LQPIQFRGVHGVSICLSVGKVKFDVWRREWLESFRPLHQVPRITPVKPACFWPDLRDCFAMPLPSQPVTLNVEQIGELNRKLSTLRHDVNNSLALIIAAVEIARRKPESTDRMLNGLAEKPQKISESVTQFSHDLEAALGITRP
jgi:hypothetical protein